MLVSTAQADPEGWWHWWRPSWGPVPHSGHLHLVRGAASECKQRRKQVKNQQSLNMAWMHGKWVRRGWNQSGDVGLCSEETGEKCMLVAVASLSYRLSWNP
jgi:hypothetical protein